MPLVGGAVMPHGALILDPERPEMAGSALGEAARKLHEGCVAASRAIRQAQAEVVLLYTPHGIIGEGADMWIYQNASASGSCEWMGSWAEHRVSVKCDSEAARSLLAHLKETGHSAAGMTLFSGYDAPLRWGEAVPLSFLAAVTAAGARVVVLSHAPAGTTERAAIAGSREAATRGMGSAIERWASVQEKRVFFLVSGDLAHVHVGTAAAGFELFKSWIPTPKRGGTGSASCDSEEPTTRPTAHRATIVPQSLPTVLRTRATSTPSMTTCTPRRLCLRLRCWIGSGARTLR